MCGSMVDIQSATAEIRRGKKEERRNHRAAIKKFYNCSAVTEMGDHLATTDMGRKFGVVPLFGGTAGSPCNMMRPGLRPTFIPSDILIHPAVWPQQTCAVIWGLCPLWGGTGSPSSTMWPGPRPTSMPSAILIHPAVWPQQTWVENWGALPPFWGGKLGPHRA